MSALFLVKEYFRIQKILFNSLKPKILRLQKRNSYPKRLYHKGEKKRRARKKGGSKSVLNFERHPLFIKARMLKEISKKCMEKILKKKKEKEKEKKIWIRVC